MKVDYKQIHDSIGDNKFYKILGWIFLTVGILSFITSTITLIDWNLKRSNYTEEYVYSEFGTLYYETNGKRIYVQDIYNTDNEKITLDIPNNKTIVMYINKDNINEGVYFDLDNKLDISILNPIIGILIPFFLVVMGAFFILTNKEAKENKYTLRPLYLFYVFLLIVGIGEIAFESNNIINHISIEKQNNTATATIYSEIYNNGKANNMYKPVAYYYVDGEKYIYVSDIYEKGTLDDKIGDTFELYYEKSNPNKVVKKENYVNIPILIIGICFVVFSFPFVFLKRKMEERIQNHILEQSKKENNYKDEING